MKKTETCRIVYIDMLRIVAAIFVLWLHMPIVMHYQIYDNGIFNFLLKVLVSLAHTCTPLFTMIMGSLLLRKNDDIIFILKHRVSRIILLLVALAFYYVINDYYYGDGLVVSNIIYYALNLTSKSLIYWYIYWWLSVVIALPLLQPLVKSISIFEGKNKKSGGGGMELLFYSFFYLQYICKFS